jgi:hypothetical protein
MGVKDPDRRHTSSFRLAGEESDPARALNRRRFLTGLVTTTAGVASLGHPGHALAALGSSQEGQEPSGQRRRIEQMLAKDGLLPRSVSGIFSGNADDSILVAVDAPIGVVRIWLTASTDISAHGMRVFGDSSVLKLGDTVDVGTDFDDEGNRVANWIISNLYAGMAWITTSDSTMIEFTPAYEGVDEQYRARVTPNSIIDVPHRPRKPEGLRRGDYVNVLCLMDAPSVDDASVMWLGSVR